MLNAIIRFALHQRLLTIAVAIFLLGYGSWAALKMPIDVFPDLDRPRVVVMAEALGLTNGQQTMAIQKRVADVLKGLGWVKGHTRRGNVWKRPTQ